jgi:hypothetical protein
MENANTSLLAMIKMYVPLKAVSMLNARVLQSTAMIAMHVPLILAFLQLDAQTSQLFVTITILAPLILAILTLDVFTLQ